MFKNYFKALFLVALLIPANQALAVTQSITARIAFATPLSITQISDISFDTSTGAASQGRLVMAGAKDQTINISVENDGAPLSRKATCSYDGGVTGPCKINDAAAPGAGRTLLLDMKAVMQDLQTTDATAKSALTVSVVYQ